MKKKVKFCCARVFALVAVIMLFPLVSCQTTNVEYSAKIDVSPETIETSLPVVLINTKKSLPVIIKHKKLNAVMTVINNTNNNTEHSAEKMKLTIKGRGNSSWRMLKKSYSIRLREKASLFGMEKHKSYALIANFADRTIIRNAIAYEIGRKFLTNLAWTPSTQNVHLFLNGEYMGVYMLTETVKIDENRVSVPNIEYYNDYSKVMNYGFLLEVNKRIDEDFNFITKRGVCFSLKDPEGDDLRTEIKKHIQNTVQTAENALFSPDFANPESVNFYGNYFDVGSFIDWWLINDIAENRDSRFRTSCYMYFDPADQKLHMGPIWDFDLGFGNHLQTPYFPIPFYTKEKALWIKRMFKDENFKSKAKERWNELYPFLMEYFNVEFKKQYAEFSPDAKKNFERWPILGRRIPISKSGFCCPYNHDAKSRKTYESECEYLIGWTLERMEYFNEEINKW